MREPEDAPVDVRAHVKHFYHCYCAGDWQAIAAEHVEALSAARWDVTVGLVGPPGSRATARAWWLSQIPCDFVEADSGWEQVTLCALRRWALDADPAAPVLYAHGKGTTHRNNDGLHGAVWRRSMTRLLITNWQECLALLESSDAVGCHWLTPATEWPPFAIESPFFGGNFWWANAGYVATLPPPGNTNRYEAEQWIGLGGPKVADLRPGIPDLAHYRLEMTYALNSGAF